MISIVYNTSFTHAAPVFLGLGTSSLKGLTSGGSISARNHPLPTTFWEQNTIETALDIFRSLVVCLFVLVAFSFIPGALVEFSVREREPNRNAKHQQYVSGASIPAYHLSSYAWDFGMYLLPCTAALVLVRSFGTRSDGVVSGRCLACVAAWFSRCLSPLKSRRPSQTTGIGPLLDGDGAEITALLLFGYGLAICPFTYLCGNLFTTHTTAQIYTILLNVRAPDCSSLLACTTTSPHSRPTCQQLITGIVLMVASYILSLFESTKDTNEMLMWIYRWPGTADTVLPPLTQSISRNVPVAETKLACRKSCVRPLCAPLQDIPGLLPRARPLGTLPEEHPGDRAAGAAADRRRPGPLGSDQEGHFLSVCLIGGLHHRRAGL